MNLIFIGREFYSKSNSIMSSIYEVDEQGNPVRRMDWGFVQIELANGNEIHIYPANENQMAWAYDRLKRFEK
jgi:hypothetical protein